MTPSSVLIAVILGVSLILAVAVHVFGRLRIEQQRTLQKLIDQGVAGNDLARIAGVAAPADRDRRRGVLLVAIGLGWTVVTFFIGGKAWLLGWVPVALGVAYLLLWKFDERRH